MSKKVLLDEELARRALAIAQTAYSTGEWLLHFRTHDTDLTLKKLEDALRAHCPSCDSTNVIGYEGEYATGVTAPDGGKEYRFEHGLRCLDCGVVEAEY